MPLSKLKPTWAGMMAPALFVLVFTLEDWQHPGYSVLRTEISALSLGSRGWIQILNFVLTGCLLLLFATGLLEAFRLARRPTIGPVLLVITAVCLLLSGPFVMDPPGTPRFLWTWHGWVHQLLGAGAFTLFPISYFVVGRTLREQTSFWRWSIGAGWAIVVALIAYLSWVFMLAYRLTHLLIRLPRNHEPTTFTLATE